MFTSLWAWVWGQPAVQAEAKQLETDAETEGQALVTKVEQAATAEVNQVVGKVEQKLGSAASPVAHPTKTTAGT